MTQDTMWKVTMRCRRNLEGEDSAAEIDREMARKLSYAAGQPVTLEQDAFEVRLLVRAVTAVSALVEGIIIMNRELVRAGFPRWPAEDIHAGKY